MHERAHTGDRPYRCDFPSCGKAFATGNLPAWRLRTERFPLRAKHSRLALAAPARDSNTRLPSWRNYCQSALTRLWRNPCHRSEWSVVQAGRRSLGGWQRDPAFCVSSDTRRLWVLCGQCTSGPHSPSESRPFSHGSLGSVSHSRSGWAAVDPGGGRRAEGAFPAPLTCPGRDGVAAHRLLEPHRAHRKVESLCRRKGRW